MSMELQMLKQELLNLKAAAARQRSATLSLMMDLKSMLQEGDIDEALERINELVGEAPE